jgi:hypothetical protein
MKRLACCLLLLSACGQSYDYDVDAAFTAEECQDILTARTDWYIATKREINLTFGVHVSGNALAGNQIIKATSRTYNDYAVNPRDDIGFIVITHPFTSTHIVMVVDRIERQHQPYRVAFRNTIRHEFGHALDTNHDNSEHTTTLGSVMYGKSGGNNPECIDYESAEAYCRHNDDCNAWDLRGCTLAPQ